MTTKCPKCQTDNPADSKFCKECAAALPHSEELAVSHTKTIEAPAEELSTGSVFAGRYQIIEELGRGGMGKVYRVLDKKLDEEIALKLIKPEIASDKKSLERFSNELKIARKIVHKNVGRMYELLEHEGTHFITMEYISGEDLKSFIHRSGRIDIPKALFLAKQVSEGLAEAHDLGVVHRDLKPSNIMIDKDGNARIMDFGIARFIKAKGITGSGVLIGTPEYMSPEQAEAKEVDHCSDIYSFGTIMYEMVTGQLPFEGDTPLSIAMKHKGEIPKNPKELNPQIPEDLNLLILKCMEKDKSDRYQTAEEITAVLNNIKKGIPTTAKEIAPKKPLTSREITVSLSMRKIFVPALIIIALSVVGLLMWHPWSKETIAPVPTDRPSLAILYFENNTGDENLDHWRSGLCDLLITDLGQSKYVHVISGERIYGILEKLDLLEKEKYSSDDLKRVALQSSVSHILRGTYLTFGDKFSLNVSVLRADTSEVISRFREEGTEEEIISTLIDKITREVKSALDLTTAQIAADIDKSVGQITTPSQQALLFYLEGWKHHLSGKYEKAIEFMEKAIVLDPGFVMAHRTIAWAYLGMFNPERFRQHMQKAFDLTLEQRDRISEREFYLIQGDFFGMSRQTWDKAVETYKKLLEVYPEDFLGRFNLGQKYFALEQWDKAIGCFESLTKYKDNGWSYQMLSRIYNLLGSSDKQWDVIEDWEKNIPDDAEIHGEESGYYLSLREFEKALAAIDKAIAADPSNTRFIVNKGFIYFVEGDLPKAREEFLKLQKPGAGLLRGLSTFFLLELSCKQGQFKSAIQMAEYLLEFVQKMDQEAFEAVFHTRFAKLHMESGNMEAALRQCEAALETVDKVVETQAPVLRPEPPDKMKTIYFKGLIKAEMGLIGEALETAERLEGLIEEDLNQKLIRFYLHLLGRIELKKENYPGAIKYFEEALSHIPPGGEDIAGYGRFTDSLALAFFKSGELEKARDIYEKIASLMGVMDSSVIYPKTFYMLGKVYEGLGDKEKATANYQKFLDLWKDADPGLPEPAYAKNRLEELQ